MKDKIILGLMLSSVAACSSKSADGESTDETSGTAQITSVADLKLSNLHVTLPDALAANSTALRLISNLKSSEACQLGQSITDVTSRLGEVASFACHIEVEKDKIVFGKKTKISFQGQEFGRLLVEKSGDKVTFAMCQQKGKQLIEVSKVTETGAAGSIHSQGTDESSSASWATALTFDLTEAGTQKIDSVDKYTMGSDINLRAVKLALSKDGVSTVSVSYKGTHQGQSFEQRGAAKFNSTHGATLFRSKGTFAAPDGSTQTIDFARRSFFTADGTVVSSSSNAAFASPDGALYVSPTEIPEYVAASYDLSFPAGWVASGCSDVDVTVELDPESSAHQACPQGGGNGESANCWDQSAYSEGTDATSELN